MPKKSKNSTPDEPKGRQINDLLRGRLHLTPGEVRMLAMAAGKLGRHGFRDMTMIQVMFRHGLRASEAANLKRSQIDLEGGHIHVKRLKRSRASTHTMEGPEIRSLRRVFREYPDSALVFPSERGGPLSGSAVAKIVERAGRAAELGFPVNAHMLRHGCGFKLANDGRDTRAIQDWLGHCNIQHTEHYTALSAKRFEGFWED